ncbi:hypothetical protein [Microvirga lotononidis]|uniref:Uncharacterized protein n=1 Tax=Microvirga lotononidis TaxID=864069 RepID=I4YM30_9HYPH|nr:hypothetical protein [Microvirga lotononidis]EIM25022.1 hypothetical protein MicloDRAFT_00057420 [Microvirga lotononidis]WQO29484.1 hypothetical protein U0023_10610 [Microvirga lotononidis]
MQDQGRPRAAARCDKRSGGIPYGRGWHPPPSWPFPDQVRERFGHRVSAWNDTLSVMAGLVPAISIV